MGACEVKKGEKSVTICSTDYSALDLQILSAFLVGSSLAESTVETVFLQLSFSKSYSCIRLVGLNWPLRDFLFFTQRTDYCPPLGADSLV